MERLIIRALKKTAVVACAALVLISMANCASVGVPKKSVADDGGAIPDVASGQRNALDPEQDRDPFPSTYQPGPSVLTAIVNATILTADGPQIDHGILLMKDGRIAAVGADVTVPPGASVIDASGRWVTPGLIDVHSHIGTSVPPQGQSGGNVNEMTNPISGNVWVEHTIWPQDPAFYLGVQSGVTTLQILPGSADLVGGRSVVLKNLPAATVQRMKFPGARQGVKMACGENPARIYGAKGRFPSTTMGNIAGMRDAFLSATAYMRDWDDYHNKRAHGVKASPPKRDLSLDTLAAAMRGDVTVQIHCYRASEMAEMIDLSHEFGFQITAFHHAIEAYKIAPLLAREGIAAVVWGGEIGGYKAEAYDNTKYNAAVADHAGVTTALHSDEVHINQHLHSEAGKAMTAGAEIGMPVARAQAIKWITANPARLLGIEQQTGSLVVGKMADVVLWNRDPFSIYSLADQVFIDGATVYDRSRPDWRSQSDFVVGQDAN